jgi:hypothetical protein
MSRKKKSPRNNVTPEKPPGLFLGSTPGLPPSDLWSVSVSIEVPESGLCPANTQTWRIFSGQSDPPANGNKKTETISVNFGLSGKIDFTVKTADPANLPPLLLRASRFSQLDSEEITVLYNSSCFLLRDIFGQKAAFGASTPNPEATLRRIKAKLGCSTNEQMVHLLFSVVPVRRDNPFLTEDQKTYLANLVKGINPSRMCQTMGLDRNQLRNLRRTVKILYEAKTGCAMVYKYLDNTGNLCSERSVLKNLGLLNNSGQETPQDRQAR